MKILLIRHADPDYAADSLTPEGHKEAEALGERIAAQGLDRLFASPLGRAQRTAGYIAAQTGLAVETEPWIRELHGWQVGSLPDGASHAWDYPAETIPTLRERSGQWRLSDDHWLRHPDKRALYDELAAHSDEFLARLGYHREGGRYRCTAPADDKRTIALVCHGGFGLAWLSWLLQLPLSHVWGGFWLPPSSVTTLLWERRSADFAMPRCLGVGDISHLYKSGLSCSTAGLYGNIE